MTDDILILPEGFAIRLRDGGHITPEAFEAAKTAPQPLPPDLRAYSPYSQFMLQRPLPVIQKGKGKL